MREKITTFRENEILTSIAILSVLSITGEMQITKCLLIEPLLSYKTIRLFLKKQNTNVRSIEELIVKQKISFVNFNNRYLEKLPISINSIFLLKELKLIEIDNEKIIFNGEDFDFNEGSLGLIAIEIIKASSKLAFILEKEEVSKLYLNLQIEL